MNSLEASIRNTKTKGDVNALREKGEVPAIVYGGTEENQKVSLSKKKVKFLIEQENFLSNIISLNINGETIKVLPREVGYDVLTDDPIHIDFLRITKGAKIIIDDIIDSGGTIVNAAQALINRGAKEVHVYITHGVLSGEAVEKIRKSKIKKLVITDTIDNSDKIKKAKNIEVLSICNLLGEAIKRISNSTSVSDLFK